VAFSRHGWDNFTLKAAGANLGRFVAKLENGRDQMISGGFEGHLIYCWLKFWRPKPPKHLHRTSKARRKSAENTQVSAK